MTATLKEILSRRCLLLLALLLHTICAHSHYVEDSLRQVLAEKNLQDGDRVMVMSNLGSMIFFTKSRKEGFDLLHSALSLSKTIKDGRYSAYTYGVLAGRYQIDNNIKAAWSCIDSAIYYSARTDNKKTKGFVAYMQGWMYTRTGAQQKAVGHYQRALRILEGEQAYTYESSIYEELAQAYNAWEDRNAWEKYIRLCYTASLNTGLPDYVVAGSYNLAGMFESSYKEDTTKGNLLDSALYYYKEALAITRENKQRIIHLTDLPYIAVCIGNIYESYSRTRNEDSAVIYLNIALKEGLKTKHYSVVAVCYSILGKYALGKNQYSLAEQMYLSVIDALKKNPSPENEIMADAYLNLSGIQEHKGNPATALNYYKEYVRLYKEEYDSEKMSEGKRLEARYDAEKKEQALKALRARVVYNRKLNVIYTVLTVCSLLALSLLLYAYKQRSRTMKQQQQLHNLEVGKIRQEHRISLLSAILEGQEQERTRLARDLHDGLGGLLSGIKIQLSEMAPVLQEQAPQNLLQKILGHLDNAVDELRRIARSMMPEILLRYGLGAAMEEYCRGLEKSGVTITCQVFHYTNRIQHEHQTVLYRIMQELVNNAIKHAAATQILVQLQESGDRVFLTVEDDGKGFDTEKTQHTKGSGLANIHARVAFLQGRMDIDSQPGTGTTVLIESSIS